MTFDHIGELPEVRAYEAGDVLEHDWTSVSAGGEEAYFEIQLVPLPRANAALEAADREVGRLKLTLKRACAELTEYERSDLEQSSSDGILPLTPDEWCDALRKRASKETP